MSQIRKVKILTISFKTLSVRRRSHNTLINIILVIIILIINSNCHAQNDNYESNFQSRANVILSYAADKYQLPAPNYSDPEKVYWPVVIARLHNYGVDDATIRSVYQEHPVSGENGLITDYAVPGNLCGLILEVTDRNDFADFQDYIYSYLRSGADLKADPNRKTLSYTAFKGFEIKAQFMNEGSFSEPVYDWGYGPLIPSHIHQSPPFVQPLWPEGKGFGRVPSVWVNGKRKYAEMQPAVYAGPDIIISKGQILID